MKNDDEMNEQGTPHISVNAQYIKDLSFENPGAPESLAKMSKNPQIELSLDLNVKNLEEDNYFEVEIVIEAKASLENQKLYLVDLKYAGVFNLINVAAEEQQFILAVHCPNIIFPYVRKMIADITQSGGFQPLMIDPINFGALYQKKMLDGQH